MPASLSDKGQQLVGDLPEYLQDDPMAQGVQDTVARELQRFEDAAKDLIMKVFPQNADDTYGSLQMWERIMGTPEKPAGVSLATRQANVAGNFRRRKAGRALDWVQILTAALGAQSWSHSENPNAFTITISTPYSSGSFTAGQIMALAAKITPANQIVNAQYDQGFLLGISLLGIEEL